jgi:hypothetical protein
MNQSKLPYLVISAAIIVVLLGWYGWLLALQASQSQVWIF